MSNHTQKDKIILSRIENKNLKDELLHESDIDILFDANEFCRKNPKLNIKFISADKNFLKAIKILMDLLCIKECIDLLEFISN